MRDEADPYCNCLRPGRSRFLKWGGMPFEEKCGKKATRFFVPEPSDWWLFFGEQGIQFRCDKCSAPNGKTISASEFFAWRAAWRVMSE